MRRSKQENENNESFMNFNSLFGNSIKKIDNNNNKSSKRINSILTNNNNNNKKMK